MKLYCPNKECGKNVDIRTNSRYRAFKCDHCGFTFRGIHALVNRIDFIFKHFFSIFCDISYNNLLSTPCLHCWAPITILSGGFDPPDSICPDTCWSCHGHLPKDRIDVFVYDPPAEKTKSADNLEDDEFWDEEYDPDDVSPDAVGTPINYYGPNATPVPEGIDIPRFIVRKKRKLSELPELTERRKRRKEETQLKIVEKKIRPKKEKIYGDGVKMLQENFKSLKKTLSSKKIAHKELYEKYKDQLEGEITMQEAFDMVRSLSDFRDYLKDDYDLILDLLVKDFQ